MKKLLKVLAVAVFAFVPFVVSSSVSATATCEIGFTGPDSQNVCTSVTEYTCTVTSTNDVTIDTTSGQEVASGPVSNSGNGQTGSSTSGSISNESGTTFAVTITNPSIGGTCIATAVMPATEGPTPPSTTPAPIVTTSGTTPSITDAVQPTATGSGILALPQTSGSFATTVLVVIASTLAAVTALGVGGVALYRYYKSL